MSYPDVEQRPTKKRRFFVEDSPVADRTSYQEPSLDDEVDALPELSPATRTSATASDDDRLSSSQADVSIYNQAAPSRANGVGGFDKGLFASFVGQDVPTETWEKLRLVAGDNMERAINMYLDGSWNTTPAPAPGANPIKSAFGQAGSGSRPSPQRTMSVANRSSSSPTRQSHLEIMPDFRYIGAFGVGAWATRSGTGLVKHGELVKIERTKTTPPVKIGRAGKPVQLSRFSASRVRADIIVRFTNARGEEVGRLPKETAAWVSTLIDQKVCKFEGHCVFAEDRVRVNDTIYLQLRCSLLKKAFGAGGFIKPQDNNRTTGIFEEKETSEEKDLRLRQVALVKLFDEINLHPSSVNETTAKHKRQGLLQAAEMAEQYGKDDGRKSNISENGGSSPPADEDEAEEGKELEQDQLDTLYKKAQSFDFNTPTREPADTFAMDLRKYQKQALHWMMSKEKDEKTENKEVSMHPLWEEYAWPTKDVEDKEVPRVANRDHFYVNPYSGELSLEFPVQEQNCLGGILADEMGLGKTIEMLSLMHSHRSEVSVQASEAGPTSVNSLPRLPKNSSSVEPAPCTTLVVAPMSLLAQWESEAVKASKPGTLKTVVYYGNDKAANLQNLCCEANAASAPNLVITSYGVVLSEFNQVAARGGDRGSHGGLFSLDFFRVILDEAHHIKNRQSKTAKACYEISAQHRWTLTGTPIVNRLEDLFSLVRFLRVEPWSNFSFWKTFITVPFESKDFLRALDVVQTVLEPLVIRRTKDMKTPDGEALVPLPPKIVEIEEIELSKAEREVYDYIYTRAKRTFNATVEAGTLLKSYTTIFAQILRLRQSCCHPVLTRNKTIAAEEEEAAAAADIANGLADDMDLQELIERFTSDPTEQDANKFGAHVLQQIQSEAGNECPICAEEPMIDRAVTGCWHSACKKCLFSYIDHQKDKHALPRCFTCREPINQRDVFEIIRHDADDNDDSLYTNTPEASPSARITLRRIGSHTSAKIAALLTHLHHLRRSRPGTAAVVFSQFTSFLDLIAPALARDRIPHLRFDGSMSQKTRAAVLAEFSDPRNAKKGTVLLLSLRAGGVGLNLTSAKRVFLMDPWWSFAVEAQAIDRVHRMGQGEEVRVVRFVVAGSIEERMLRVQERKKFIASSLGMMSEEERKMQRIEDIKELLS
ncbi:dna repair protein rad-5 [Lasallia pustulata]|uniref:Dna repair protein rad-5 n=1 Tax=Lasallia pustulata TaxID=136370 RepID=A0A1W5D0Z3_9LECA|nr:dna repair protein rad-5 [Lasallia pustulata]